MDTKKIDYFGRELNIGDEVVFMSIKYRTLVRGYIVKLSDKKATIEHPDDSSNGSRSLDAYIRLYGTRRGIEKFEEKKNKNPKTKSIQFYNQIIKVF